MGQIGMICEQGDLGLMFDPLNENDKKKYEEQQRKEAEKHKNGSKRTSNQR